MLSVAILSQNAAAGGGFTPGALAPAAWYDPSDLSSMFQDTAGTTPVTAAGQSVALIRDKSGNGLHLTQATGTKAPLYQSDGSLLFDGVDDYLTNASTISGNNQAIVSASNATGSASQTLWDVTVATGDRIAVGSATNAVGLSARYFNGTVTTGLSAAGSAGAKVLTAEINKTTPTVGLRVNSVAAVTSSTSGPGSTTGTFLGSSNGAAAFYAGKFYGLVQLARTITSAERASLETWLGAKCGVTL